MHNRKQQQGAVLAIGLMILLVLTILVVTSNGSTLQQEKMSSALLDGQVSLQTVESAIEDAEAYVNTLQNVSGFDAIGTKGLYSEGNGPSQTALFSSSTWASGKYQSSGSYTLQNNSYQAQYLIENLGTMSVPNENMDGMNLMGYGQTTGGGDVNAFRVVARAAGSSGSAERMVEIFFGRRL